mmetsp:Transcript_21703/g.51877  ORF Transcript_21703/g.51877 Transcript_21703/m.51877 type:complete len:351 (-) Transcript_21703:192-1244(-)
MDKRPRISEFLVSAGINRFVDDLGAGARHLLGGQKARDKPKNGSIQSPAENSNKISLIPANASDFHASYEVEEGCALGKGSYSTVLTVKPKSKACGGSTVSETYACKVLEICPEGLEPKEGQSTREQVHKELALLKSIRHPNLIELRDHFVCDNKCLLLTPLMKGGSLQAAVDYRGSLPEDDAKEILRQVLSGLAHLHSYNIAHRDLKLENILLLDDCDTTKVMIVDFGMAKILAPDDPHTICGSPHFIAPEMLDCLDNPSAAKAKYGTETDIWSCGVVSFMLLGGYPPFTGSGLYSLFKKIRSGKCNFSDPVWELVSEEAKDFLFCMLQTDPRKRPSAAEALGHSWLSG